ncbi:MAG: DUF1295 domain-containing protein [Bowdeniella nasicola]|nr:DUF1295 domain-containing protein [Bowdeniella nasicola]
MTKPRLIALLTIATIAAIFAAAGSVGMIRSGHRPIFALVILAVFIIQWIGFTLAYWRRTEEFFDLLGAVTYLALTVALVIITKPTNRGLLLAGLVSLWAARLGSFLWRRVRHAGGDRRFDVIKHDALRFFITWNLQALWITITASAAWMAITTTTAPPLGALAIGGTALWLCGFSIEVIADQQKSAFRANPANANRPIMTGLWAYVRHPNYCGEILMWVAIALIALPALSGWQYLSLSSPVFVAVLLTKISGIPLLEKAAQEKWGDDETWRRYRARTPALIPRFGARKESQ